jgi:predicted nucleic acid-binding protein
VQGAEPAFPGGASVRYIESSALIAAKLEGDAGAWQAIRGEGQRFASALTLAEFARRVIRGRQQGEFDDARVRMLMTWLQRFARRRLIVDVNGDVLARVRRPFPLEPVRTLDAIHLATIESRDEDPSLVAVVTRDSRIAGNARAMGYGVE